jgi:hypothetical protein
MYKRNPELRALVEKWAAELEGSGCRFTVSGRREQVLVFWESGLSQREIARATGSTRRTVRDDLAAIVGGFEAIIGSKPPTLSERQLATMKRILWLSPSCVEEIAKIDPGYVEQQKKFDQINEALRKAGDRAP